jgi:hypothetical protein
VPASCLSEETAAGVDALAAVHALAPGRVCVAVGPGEGIADQPVADDPGRQRRERGRRLAGAAALLRADTVPVCLAVSDPRLAYWAGRFADGVVCTGEPRLGVCQSVIAAMAQGSAEAVSRARAREAMIEIQLPHDPGRHDRVLARVDRCVDLGFTHVVFHAAGREPAARLEELRTRIMPRLRDRAAAAPAGRAALSSV